MRAGVSIYEWDVCLRADDRGRSGGLILLSTDDPSGAIASRASGGLILLSVRTECAFLGFVVMVVVSS